MYRIPFVGFDWDAGNSEKIMKKHGIAKKEVEDYFRGEVIFAEDPRHSQTEQRYLAMGMTGGGRFMLVSFTIRHLMGRRLLRPISARYMHAKEIKEYEKANKVS